MGIEDISSRNAKLRNQAEMRLAKEPSEGGFWYSVADCQRMIHELRVYEIELDLMGEELATQQSGLQAWRDEARKVQLEFKEVAGKISLMEDGPDKDLMGIQCIQATLRLFEERFKLLVQRGGTEAP